MVRVIIVLFLMSFGACSLSSHQKNESKQVREQLEYWIGRNVVFPKDHIDTLRSQYCIYAGNVQTDYKILVYVDSSACTSCNLDFFLWNELAEDANKTLPKKISFLFYCQPKNNGERVLKNLMSRDKFEFPLFSDSTNQIGNLNDFKDAFQFQCFLLGKFNEILVMGDPTQNMKLWEYYKKIIMNKL